MKLFYRLSASVVYLFGIYYVLGKNINALISLVDFISLVIGAVVFFFLFYKKKKTVGFYLQCFKRAVFWSGFFISIIHLISLFEDLSVYTTISKEKGLVFLILINCRPLLYANSILILLYSKDETNNKENTTADTKEMQQLTSREKEIALLIANDKTNAEIAEKLFISPFTVKKHVYNIFSKLHISQRSEIKYIINSEKTKN